MLRRLGFDNVLAYDELDELYPCGCVVVRIVDAEDPELAALNAFLTDRVQQSEEVGVILYTEQHLPRDLVEPHPLVTFANSEVTLGVNLLTLARLVDR